MFGSKRANKTEVQRLDCLLCPVGRSFSKTRDISACGLTDGRNLAESMACPFWYSDFCGVLAAFRLTFYFDSNMKISPCGGFRRSVGHPN